MSDKKKSANKEVSPDELVAQIAQLSAQVEQAQEAERRARADYQNLVRRNQEERAQLVKFAAKSFVEEILQPLEHLQMAAQQLNDAGLNMVVEQLWKALEEQGLQVVEPIGEPFDISYMEVVDIEDGIDENKGVVIKIVRPGFKLNGEVIQHAKVVIGKK